jgi:hypothetical protein
LAWRIFRLGLVDGFWLGVVDSLFLGLEDGF